MRATKGQHTKAFDQLENGPEPPKKRQAKKSNKKAAEKEDKQEEDEEKQSRLHWQLPDLTHISHLAILQMVFFPPI